MATRSGKSSSQNRTRHVSAWIHGYGSGSWAWRQAALVDIYRINNENDKSANARKKAIALAQEVAGQAATQGDWKPRALALIYKLEQNVPVYGNQQE